MEDESPGNVTQALLDWSQGNPAALSSLMPHVYEQLRNLASRTLRDERQDHTLQTTALVHEVYLKLVDQRQVNWQHRVQFFAVSAHLMRRILVDHARRHSAVKRGSGASKVALDAETVYIPARHEEMIALDLALERLAALNQRQSRIVELRYFGGLSLEETADVLKVSTATVKNDWRVARAWLFSELDRSPS